MTVFAGRRVLAIDDNLEILELIGRIFKRFGAEVRTASDGKEGLRQALLFKPDLVLLDVMMPEMDGWHVCRHLRRFTDVPVIMLTVLDRHRDVVRSLDSGADYYLTKPFSPAVLLERSRAALRRNENAAVRRAATGCGVGGRNPVIYSDAYLTIDVDQRCALADGKPIQLSRIESRLLAYLLQNAPRILHFDQILENVWGDVQQSHTDNLHICMWHLRQKLERDPGQPEYLLNEYGVGYSFQIKVGLTEFA